jgi:hypothetical protein
VEKHEPHTAKDFLREEQKYTVSQTTLDALKDTVETIGQGAIPKSPSWIERQTHLLDWFSTDDHPKPDWKRGLEVVIDRREGNIKLN